MIRCAIDGCGGREDEIVDVVGCGVGYSVGRLLLRGLGKGVGISE